MIRFFSQPELALRWMEYALASTKDSQGSPNALLFSREVHNESVCARLTHLLKSLQDQTDKPSTACGVIMPSIGQRYQISLGAAGRDVTYCFRVFCTRTVMIIMI